MLNEIPGLSHRAKPNLGILAHDVNLNTFFSVVIIKTLIIIFQESGALFPLDFNRHSPTHDCHAVVQRKHFLLMQVQQYVLNGLAALRLWDSSAQLKIQINQAHKFAERSVHQQVFVA
ncbi:hypothetical protein D3C77_386400 [compost metagenome]